MDIRFLNVDLEIESSENLQPIIDDFGENVSVLYSGENGSSFNFASFEVVGFYTKDIDEIISAFCTFIDNLSSESKSILEKSHSIKFNCGFQSGDFPRSYETQIRPDTVERIAKFGASVVITIYPKPE